MYGHAEAQERSQTQLSRKASQSSSLSKGGILVNKNNREMTNTTSESGQRKFSYKQFEKNMQQNEQQKHRMHKHLQQMEVSLAKKLTLVCSK